MMTPQELVTLLVALIGAAGVVGAALVTQIMARRTELPTVDAETDLGHLYRRIGRLEAELEDCRADLKPRGA